MMRQGQQLQKIQIEVLDAFMAVDSEFQQAFQKAITRRNLRARRGIETHFEQKQLRKEQDLFSFD